MDCIFPKYPIFQLLRKKWCGERNSRKKFWKKRKQVRETIKKNKKKKWEENFRRDSGRKKKDVGRKFRKITLWIVSLHVPFF